VYPEFIGPLPKIFGATVAGAGTKSLLLIGCDASIKETLSD